MRVADGRVVRAGQDLPPAASSQRGLWFLHQLDPSESTYNVCRRFRLRGFLDPDALARSLEEVVRRHEILRTTFVAVDGEPFQVASPAWSSTLSWFDLGELRLLELEREAARLTTAEARRPFDLSREHPFRAQLLRLGPDDHVLTITAHHIAVDGWSLAILLAELSDLYASCSRGEPSRLPESTLQYADFAWWQRDWLASDGFAEQLEYWRENLDGAPTSLLLPSDWPRPLHQTFRGASRGASLPEKMSAQVRAVARREGTTTFMALLAAFAGLLYRYSGREDVVVGTVASGRTRPELMSLVGCFVNTLPLRVDISDNPTLRTLLARTSKASVEALGKQEVPFDRLIEEVNPERSTAYSPLVQVMFNFQNTPPEELALGAATAEAWEIPDDGSKFDLTLDCFETGACVECNLEYSTDLFSDSTADLILGDFAEVVSSLARDPEQRIGDVALTDTPPAMSILDVGGPSRCGEGTTAG